MKMSEKSREGHELFQKNNCNIAHLFNHIINQNLKVL